MHKPRRLLSKAVYLFSIGGNDYIKLTSDPSIVLTPIDELKYVGMVLGNFTTVIKAIYNKGGRKFAFQNVGPLGCMPATTSMAPKNSTIFKCVEEPQTIARLHNTILSKLLERLAIQLPEFKYSLFDYHTSLAERTLSPFKFGFKIGENACCGSGRHNGHFTCGQENYTLCSNPGEHVWFDAGHPTESTNKQLADLLWSGHPNVTAPYTLKMFFEK
ncbi:hypothetical protein L1049_004469 [Liquidambar formosana]|uniref:Uncharacterized protein n=1 Tax=Liquidambar formosana TaxID=63359 RepID=A0AAP0RTX0_LIQFO